MVHSTTRDPETLQILSLAQEKGLDLDPDTAVLDDNGWDFRVVHAVARDGLAWVLRVPRRPEIVTAAAAEGLLLAVLRDRFTVAIPDWRVADSELIAYPRLAGEPAVWENPQTYELHWRIDRRNPPTSYVTALGEFMAELHSTPTADVAATGIPFHSAGEVRTRFGAQLAVGAAELGIHPTWQERGQHWLDRDELWAETTVLIHGDLHPGHTLVDDDGVLLGILDWTDAEIGDPGTEFVEAARKFEPAMLDQLIDSYERHGGPVWPGLRAHVNEAIAFAPLALGVLGLEAGKQRYVQAARTSLGIPTA